MGFFSLKMVVVSSTLYNLAGDALYRPNYLKTTVIGGVLGESNSSLGETISSAYITGPAMRIRRYYNWAKEYYPEVGIPDGHINGSFDSADQAALLPHIPGTAGSTVKIQEISAGAYDSSFFAERKMLESYPDKLDLNWFSDVDEVSGAISLYTGLEDGEGEDAPVLLETFTHGFDQTAQFIYVIYSLEDDTTKEWSNAQMYIYQLGSGNSALDALVPTQTGFGRYVPYIPMRLDNEMLSPTYMPEVYAAARRAYRRSIGGRLNKIMDSIEDNESIDEIDYAYIVFGVPLNVIDNRGREYIYRFFEELRQNQVVLPEDYMANQAVLKVALSRSNNWQSWKEGQGLPSSPLYGTPEPERGEIPPELANTVQIKSNGTADTNMNMLISWGTIIRTTGNGIKEEGKKAGDYWLTALPSVDEEDRHIYTNGKSIKTSLGNKLKPVTIAHQIDSDNWEMLTVHKLYHKNRIYKKKSVIIGGSEALEEITDPPESGFILPIHIDVFKQMRLIDSTQMMSTGSYVVFNCYKKVKKKWYQTGFFKVFLFVAVIAISVALPGVGGALAPGLLGTASAVGASLGLSGLIGAIAGAILNAIAAMIVTKLIGMAATFVLGAKWGQLIGSIVSMMVMSFGPSLMSGGSMHGVISQMMSTPNLINMTSSVADMASTFMSNTANEINQDRMDYRKEHLKKMHDLTEKFAEEFGYDKGYINPLSSTDNMFGNYSGYTATGYFESSNSFLSRTLMTGSDIAELSNSLITDFTKYTLSLEK